MVFLAILEIPKMGVRESQICVCVCPGTCVCECVDVYLCLTGRISRKMNLVRLAGLSIVVLVMLVISLVHNFLIGALLLGVIGVQSSKFNDFHYFSPLNNSVTVR